MSPKRLVLSVGALLVVAVGGLGGYLIGQSKAPTESGARSTTKAAFKDEFQPSFKEALASSLTSVRKTGPKQGERPGTKQGLRDGRKRGQAAVDSEASRLAAAEAEAARLAEQAEFSNGEQRKPPLCTARTSHRMLHLLARRDT